MTANVRQLTQTALVLRASADSAGRQMAAVVARGALNIKNGWRANATATAGQHAKAYPYSVSYDIHPIPGGAHAEIGPDKDKPQGALGNLLEFGSVHNAPHNDGGKALLTEAPQFEAHVRAVTLRMPW